MASCSMGSSPDRPVDRIDVAQASLPALSFSAVEYICALWTICSSDLIQFNRR
jgi:hypothetical protein